MTHGNAGEVVAPDGWVSVAQVTELVDRTCRPEDYRGRRVLLIVPDGTRTAPIGLMFKTLFARLGGVTSAFDVLIALGTHPAMSEEAICGRLEITAEERSGPYGRVRFFNHEWDNPAALRSLGSIPADEIHRLSGGLFSMEV
ncbi:MAG: lactate racemase domain-containing protein, partial [Verrucomicrobiota bacterium]